MDWDSERNWAELAADVAAAASFAAALAYAHSTLVQAGPATAAIAAAAFLIVTVALGQVSVGERDYALADFEPVPIEPALDAQGEAAAELLLHDELTAVDPNARVVQLFAPTEGPGTGGLDSRGSGTELPDASRALIDALCELRRSFH